MSNHVITEDHSTVQFNPLFLPIALIACGVVGGVLAFISYNYFSLIVIFPVIMGVVAGTMARQVVKQTDGGNSFKTILLAIVLALITYGVYRYAEYYLTFEEFGNRIKAIATFPNYLNWSAEQGISITRATQSDSSGLELTGQGVWIFWGVEILIMLFVAFSSSRNNDDDQAETVEEEAV